MVMQKSMMKYMTRMGQNTGTLKASKNVQIIAMMMPFVAECLKHQPNARRNQRTRKEYTTYIKETEKITTEIQESLKTKSNEAIYKGWSLFGIIIEFADRSSFYFDWTEARAAL